MDKKAMAGLLEAEPCSGCPNKVGIETLFSNVTEKLSHTQHELWAANVEIALQKKYVEEIGTTLDTALEELEKGLQHKDDLEARLANVHTQEDVAELERKLEAAEATIAQLWMQLENARESVRTARDVVREAEATLAASEDAIGVERMDDPPKRKIRGAPPVGEIERYNVQRHLKSEKLR